ncbi:12348_t:CDS:2, partial [Cetraspora pellucida]
VAVREAGLARNLLQIHLDQPEPMRLGLWDSPRSLPHGLPSGLPSGLPHGLSWGCS